MTNTFPDGISQKEYASQVQEIRNPFYEYPEDRNVRIWRYMDFTKFVSLLDSSSLYFANASYLGDPFEGSVSKYNLRVREGELDRRVNFFWETACNSQSNTTLQELKKSVERLDSIAAKHLSWTKNWTYISCWHVNECESAAMWKLYAATNQAVAIVSTFQRFLDALAPHVAAPHGEPRVSLVKYIDYQNEMVPRNVHLSEFFCKRLSFSHERELRAVVQRLPVVMRPGQTAHSYDITKESVHGISFSVDLNQLIEEVRVAPTAPDWIFDLVEKVCLKYGVKCGVVRSEMDQAPVY